MLCLHDANSVAVGQDNRRAHIATQIRRLSHQLRVSEPAAGILADSAVLNLGDIQMHNVCAGTSVILRLGGACLQKASSFQNCFVGEIHRLVSKRT